MCEDGVGWIYEAFRDCVVSDTDKWSFGIGMLSNVIWVIFGAPQIYSNWKTKEVAGQSPALFTLLFFGSVLSLVGVIVTGGLVTQIVTGIVYAVVDGITFAQFWWYGCIKRKCTKRERRRVEVGGGQAAGVGVLALSQLGSSVDWRAPYSHENVTGTVFGWVGAVVYIASRVPQVVENVKNKKVLDLSVGFVILSILGNVTYSGSLVIRSREGSFMWKQAPFLTGSLGPLSFDFVLLFQMMIYGIGSSDVNKNEASEEEERPEVQAVVQQDENEAEILDEL